MPIVPGGNGPDSYAIPTGALDARQPMLDPSAGAQQAQALVGLGDKMQQAQQQTSDTVLRLQHMNNESNGNNINNQVAQKNNELLYSPGGFYSLSGKDAVAAYPKVMAELQANRSWGMQQAGNQDEQLIVQQGTNYLMNREMNSVGMHYAQESKQYNIDSKMASAHLSAKTAALNWNNPQAIDSAFHTATDAANQIGALQGSSPDSIKDMQLTLTSQAASGILDMAMAKNPKDAMGLYNQFLNAGYLDAQTASELGARLRRATMPGEINDISDGVIAAFNAQNTTNGSDGGSMTPPTVAQSGARPINNPFNLRKVGAATGFMQYPTMQDGIAAGEEDLLQKNKPTSEGGDGLSTIAQIITKYAPPGDGNNTSSYITQVAAAAGVDPNAPIDLSNKTLMAKVSSAIMEREGDMPGSVPTPDDLMANLPQLQEQARQLVQPKFPDQADAGDMAAQRIFSKVLETKNAFDTQQKGMADTVLSTVESNKITDPLQLLELGGAPASAWLGLAPQYRSSVLAQMKQNVPGAATQWSPAADKAVSFYRGLAVTNPKAFLAVDFDNPDILNLVPHNQLQPLIQEQINIKNNATGPVSPKEINGALSLVQPILDSAGIVSGNAPAWRDGGAANLSPSQRAQNDQVYNQMVGQFTEDYEAFKAQNDRAPGADELQKMAQRLVLKGSVNGTTEMLFQAEQGGKIDPNFLPDIPTTDLAAINRQYFTSYGRYPDQTTAARIYLSSLSGQGNTSDFLRSPPVPGADVASSLPGGLNFETRSASPAQSQPNKNRWRLGAGMH